MKSQISLEQAQWFRNLLHCDLHLTTEQRMKWSTPLSTWRSAPDSVVDIASPEREQVYEIRICESDLKYLMNVLQSHEYEKEMQRRYPQVQEAWISMRSLMMLLSDAPYR